MALANADLVHLLISRVNLTTISPYLPFRELSIKRALKKETRTNRSSPKYTPFNSRSKQSPTTTRSSLLVSRIRPSICCARIHRSRQPSSRPQFPAQAAVLGARMQWPRILNLQQPPASSTREVGRRGQGRVSHLRCGLYSNHGPQHTRRSGEVQRRTRIIYGVAFVPLDGVFCPNTYYHSSGSNCRKAFSLVSLSFL